MTLESCRPSSRRTEAAGAFLARRYSDRVGHRRLWVWCLLAGGAFAVAQAFARGTVDLALLRFMQGGVMGACKESANFVIAYLTYGRTLLGLHKATGRTLLGLASDKLDKRHLQRHVTLPQLLKTRDTFQRRLGYPAQKAIYPLLPLVDQPKGQMIALQRQYSGAVTGSNSSVPSKLNSNWSAPSSRPSRSPVCRPT